MNIPFLDLKKVNNEIMYEIQEEVENVLNSGWYILGKYNKKFEKNFSRLLVNKEESYVISCNSGTDALILSLLASGVGADDEVITVANTAIPTVAAICAIGACPVFVDVNPNTWLMDISRISESISPRTKAIIPVHLYGNMVNIAELRKHLDILKRNDVIIIEDVAQAQGSLLNNFEAGTIGDYGAFSFYPSKNIGALGDGGAVFCLNKSNLEKLRMLRNYGQKDRYNAEITRGVNSRLDEIQAAILDIKLKYISCWNNKKQQMVSLYRRELSSLPLKFQAITDNCIPAWHLCVIELENEKVRRGLECHLERDGIQTLIHYPIPLHKQKAFLGTSIFNDLHVTESKVVKMLSIPMNIALTPDDQSIIINSILNYFK